MYVDDITKVLLEGLTSQSWPRKRQAAKVRALSIFGGNVSFGESVMTYLLVDCGARRLGRSL